MNIRFLALLALLFPLTATAELVNDFRVPGLAPHLGQGDDGTVILSLIERRESGPVVRYYILQGEDTGPGILPFDKKLFVNWADFPSVEPVRRDLWVAHALVRRPAGGYAYDIHATFSHDQGRNWSEPFLLHDDGTDTEHGFVTLYPHDDGFAAVWLDGRMMTGGHGGSGAMTLRSGVFDKNGKPVSSKVIDDRTCDCCQTDVAATPDGPLVVYRDRSVGEIRDIYFSHHVDGIWSNGEPVARDGWNIAGCPVNGPTVDALDDMVAVTWFTAANDAPAVRSAWSLDGGQTFQQPVEIAQDNALGYVATQMLSENRLLTAWVCRNADSTEICFRIVGPEGESGPVRHLGTGPLASRMTVPQLAVVRDQVLFVWTEGQSDNSKVVGKYVQTEHILNWGADDSWITTSIGNRSD